MEIGAIIIGDEILSGKRQDKHLSALIQILNQRGLKLSWAEYIGDNPIKIRETFKKSVASGAVVFSFGGIGSTPDDRTRECAAEAMGIPLAIHPEGKAILESRFSDDMLYPHRIHMVNFPLGASLIPNPVNQIPGFYIQNHYFVPGFPSMAWPMVEWVLDTHYADCFPSEHDVEKAFRVFGVREGDLVAIMQQFVATYPLLGFSSLPSFGNESHPAHVEFGVRGKEDQVDMAIQSLWNQLAEAGIKVDDIRQIHS